MYDKWQKVLSAVLVILMLLIPTVPSYAEMIPGTGLSIGGFIAFVLLLIMLGGIYLFQVKLPSASAAKVKEKYPNLSIVAIIYQKKLRQTRWALLTFVLSSILVLGQARTAEPYPPLIMIIPFVLAALLYLSNNLLLYRILRGWYGNNEREAREIIQFIRQESSDIDFTDGGKPKKIMTDADLEEIRQSVARAVPSSAGPA